MAKKKTAPRRKPKAAKSIAVVDVSPELAELGFFRGEYHWEADREVSALGARLRLNVDHVNGRVAPEQTKSVELLLESKASLRLLALKAAYDCMLRWVEGYRSRHPDFRGKPIGEKPFMRGCELKTVLFPSPAPGSKPTTAFILSLFWPDDNRPCEVRFERKKSGWVVTECERN